MIESVGKANTIYTVEPNPEDDNTVIVTYWLENGIKIGQLNVKRGEPQ